MLEHRFIIPLDLYRQQCLLLQSHPPGTLLRFPFNVSHTSEGLELMAAPIGSHSPTEVGIAHYAFPQTPPIPPDLVGVILESTSGDQMTAAIQVQEGKWQRAHSVVLPGSGMHQLYLSVEDRQDPLRAALAVADGEPISLTGPETALVEDLVLERWSRTRAALGGDVHNRYVDLRFAWCGGGRSASHGLESSARSGVRTQVIIEPDILEMHNLGEMTGVKEEDVTHHKASVIADYLRVYGASPLGPMNVIPVVSSISRQQGFSVAKGCDVLISTVDNDAARLSVAGIAALYNKVHLDVATGIHGQGSERIMGGDVRLMLPGHCLVCSGGLANLAQASEVLSSANAEERFHEQRDWTQERSGSLISLNMTVVGFGLRMLEDLVAERITGSRWLHFEFDADGDFHRTYPPLRPPDAKVSPASTSACGLCRLRGQGDSGLPALREFITSLNQRH